MNAEQHRRPAVASSVAPGLPIPAGWAGRRTCKALASVAFLVLLAVGLAACGGLMLWSSDPSGIFLGAVAILLGHVAVLGFRVRSMRRRRGVRAALVADPKATTDAVRFTYSAWTYYWTTSVLVMTELLALALTVSPLVPPNDVLDIAAAILFGGLASFLGWFLVTMLRLAPGQVTLSPAGVFHRGLTFMYFVPWYAVVSVTARWLGTPLLTVEAHPSEDTGVRRYMGRLGTGDLKFFPIMVIRTAWLPDPVLVYHALCFYHVHPDLRAELSTQDGVDRINSGRAVCQEPEQMRAETGAGERSAEVCDGGS